MLKVKKGESDKVATVIGNKFIDSKNEIYGVITKLRKQEKRRRGSLKNFWSTGELKVVIVFNLLDCVVAGRR